MRYNRHSTRYGILSIKPRCRPMKQSLLFLSMIVSAGSLFAREPVWVFNNGPDAKLISLGQGKLHHEVGSNEVDSDRNRPHADRSDGRG